MLIVCQTTHRLLTVKPQASKQAVSGDDLPMPDVQTIEKLNQTATARLSDIVRRSSTGERGWTGYDAAEVIAAKELLSRDAAPITR